jgi:hypothetical protein
VAWAGPIAGALLPLAAALAVGCCNVRGAWAIKFFAGFCLLANGAYIGLGWIDRIGDAGDLLFHGAPLWTLWCFGAASAAAGLAVWHGMGQDEAGDAAAKPSS